MASIRRKPNSPFWYACITRSDGKQVQRSTKQTDRRRAMAIAMEWEEGEREAREGHLTELAARKHIAKCYRMATGRDLQHYTVKQWIASWLKDKKATKRPTTFQRYEGASKGFLASLGERAHQDLRHVDVKDVECYRRDLLASGKKNRSVNLDIKAVSICFNKAVKQGILERNPFLSLDSLPVSESTKQPFTDKQVADILKNCPSEWMGAILVGFYTGMRLSDAVSLRWKEIELDENIPLIRFNERKKQDKHRREIIVPVHSRLLEHFLSMNREEKEAPLFPTLSTKGTGGNTGLSQSFRRIMLKAGIIKELYSKKKKGVGRTVSPYGFHSLRHTFKTNLANQGVPKEIYDTLTGHAKPSVAEAYVHRDPTVLLEAVEKLPCIKVA